MVDRTTPVEIGVTRRELEVLGAVAEHLSNAEVADRLFVSERTVESHVSSLLRKLGAANRRELARLAPPLLGEEQAYRTTNLPSRSTTFVGRDTELDALERATGDHRLVTLVGPAGIGKTRLALEAAARSGGRYPGGTWFVDLAALDRPAAVPGAVAAVLQVVAQPGEDLSLTIAAALERRPATLLILDNCEHVLDAAAGVCAAVVAAGGCATILATSRQALGGVDEVVLPIPPLAEAASLELFVDRARRCAPAVALQDSDHAALARICGQLDHLPLAIELAATQIRLLEPSELADRLDQRFRLLARPGHGPARHQSIEAAVDWSYERLRAPARRLFERLSVFAGSCTLDAAEAVCAGDGIGRSDVLPLIADLLDRCMLDRHRGVAGTARYGMLHSLRLYGRERLEAAGLGDRFREAHAAYVLAMAQEAATKLFGPEEGAWVARLRAEEPTLRAAQEWARANDRTLALRLCVALWPYWNLSLRQRDAIADLRALLSGDGAGEQPGAVAPDLRAWAMAAAALLSAYNRETASTRAWAEDAIAAFRETGEDRGLAYARLALGWAHAGSGALDDADATLAEALALADASGDPVLVGLTRECLGHVALWRGDYAGARRWHELELATWMGCGSARQQGWAYAHLAHTARSAGDLDRAVELAEQALGCLAGGLEAAHVRTTLADVARLQGRTRQATSLYRQLAADFAEVGDRRCLASTCKNLGQLAVARSDVGEALGLFLESLQLRHLLGDTLGVAECLDNLAAAASAAGRSEESVTLLSAAAGVRDAAGATAISDERVAADALVARGRASLPAGQFERAWAAGAGLDCDAAVAWARACWPATAPAGRAWA